MVSESVIYNCELGNLKISAVESHVTEITFLQDTSRNAVEISSPQLPVLKTCIHELNDYFSGKRKEFSFSFEQNGTVFQRKVWRQLQEIPFGKTISYLTLSKKLGDPKVIRAAASANGKNALAIVIPCHRVIGTNGALVGYAGELWRKQWLLNHEARFAHGVQSLF